MKPCIPLVEINIFLLNNVTITPTKTMTRTNQNWAHFWKMKISKNRFLLKIGISLVKEKKWKDSTDFQH